MGTSDHNLRVTFVLPVLNETFSLRKTVDYILELCRDQAHELLIVIAEKTTQESLSVIYDLQRTYGSLVRIHKQELPLLGGALREAFH